ncbi:MAG: multidrug efflux pump subunit AcrB [Akkermansiaceae bacterium]|jgi:multidrug efflux pump subunit AcrB
MLNPASITLNNSRTAMTLYFGIMLFGVITYLSIGNREYPAITIRNAVVITQYPGRSTVQVEQEVTEPIEQAIRQLPQVHKVTSTSKPGLSIITVEIDENYFQMEDIWTDMRNKISVTKLPSGTSTPAINDDFGDEFPYVYALRGNDFTPAELKDYGDLIRDRLLALDGVGKVEFHGNQEERIFLEFSSSELAARGISPQQVASVLNAQNAVVNSGSADYGDERLQIVTLGEFESLDELSSYPLALPGQSSSIRISDLFTVTRSYDDPATSRSHFNANPILCIAVSMKDGGVVTAIGEGITQEIAKIQQDLPLGLEIETMFYQPVYVTASINAFIVNLIQAFACVLVIMFIFSGWRLALLVGILVPSAILLCFTFMPAFGVELEMMSIAALIIALGILVDNAVVVCEQVLDRLNQGMDRMQAVTQSVQGLIIPLLAGSSTTIAAFGIIAMAQGATAEFTFSLFAVVALTLLGSWVLSLTIIPFFAYYFLKPLKKDTPVGRLVTKISGPYEKLLRLSLRLRWSLPLGAFALTLVAGWGMKFVPNIFFPPNERGQFVVDFELPLGTNIAETESQVERLEHWLLTEKKDDVKSVSTWIGNGGPRWYLSLAPQQASPNYAFFSILTTTEDPAQVNQLVDDLNEYARDQFPAARIAPKALESGPPVGDPIQIKLRGPDLNTLYELRDKIAGLMRETDGAIGVRDNWGVWTKQISIDPDPVRLSRLGLNTTSLASALSLQYQGLAATTYREGEHAIPVILRSREDFRENLDRLHDLPVFGAQSGIVPLSQAADIDLEFQPGSICRWNTQREMIIKCRVQGRYSSEVLADLKPKIETLIGGNDWPSAYSIEWAGERAESAKSQQKLAAGAPIPIAILCLILIAQFNSLRAFAIIMMTVPPMLIGVVSGLIVTGSSFGFMTLLGLIALMGIVVNNAILLIDETRNQLAADEKPNLIDCVVNSAKSRFRPIIMTTATTVFGLLPLAISGGGMWSSMAYAMMFGLAFATVLTLLLCPTLFYLLHRRKYPSDESPKSRRSLAALSS